MSNAITAERAVLEDFANAVIAGLSKAEREIPARFLYDRAGSDLFEQITNLPEYYPTRTEISLIQRHAAAIGEEVGRGRTVVEFGSGSSAKTPPFLSAVGAPRYVPIDISAHFLETAAKHMRAAMPDLDVLPLPGDFTQPLALPQAARNDRKLGFFPGSTIGNMSTRESVDLLRAIRATLGDSAPLIIGIDLKKEVEMLEAAYDDSRGVTAEFITGILRRMQEDLGAGVEIDDWAYDSFWNPELGRVEMHVKARRDTAIDMPGHHWQFSAGEHIHVSNSHKYSLEESAILARAAGYLRKDAWTDDEGIYSLQLWQPMDDDLSW
ncbi:L-histidine N(alpha)-methyltransferase [Pacificimonas flava]|uniref:L-histidine N(Alpha)-methyltransferase n=2 Tax=Pacificimonas TaxID=1960290 RepID=A0A219B3J5_9SPHN|nr:MULTISPECIES: L-histidine N(alpha)-methyltransferase [Pacificimonas]MBZ6377597.1 L-histidine N(alpha)-methyltransferase [Pacificimonas aurantium]OWV32713.1 L-histidine N(alpha)-methyltransferase [Pacificimonas flava]